MASKKSTKTPEELRKARSEAGKIGGRNKRGKRSHLVLEREAVLEAWKNGVHKRTQSLLQAQTMLAMGAIKVFRIDYEWRGIGKNRYKIAKKPDIVISEEEIMDALDHEYGAGESPSDDMKFYFVMTKDPDNSAINSLLDRTFGRAKESIEISAPVSVDSKDKNIANDALSKFLNKK